jgi:hypothetical protein
VSERLSAALGYDPDRVAELPASMRRALGLVALAALPALVLLTVSAGYGAWLASDAKALGVAVGVGAGLYLLNLLRVAVAGGGVGPQQPFARVTTFMPRTVPLVMLGLLGIFFAQPLILGWLSSEQDRDIDELRQALVTMHATAVLEPLADLRRRAEAGLAQTRARLDVATTTRDARQRELEGLAEAAPGGRTLERALAEDERRVDDLLREVARQTSAVEASRQREADASARDVARYRQHLERSHFLLRRVQLTWARPLRPALGSLLMMVLMVLPWLASATVGRTAARAYEAGRWKVNRALIDAAYAVSRREEAAALARWPTFTGQRLELHEDAPYDTRPRAGAGVFEAGHG